MDMDKFFNQLLPYWIRKRLLSKFNDRGVSKYISNAGWLFTARATTLATSFLTIAVVARYLGPENLGKLSYAQSIVAIFSVIAALGIDQIVFRELIKRPNEQNLILGTAIIAKLGAGAVALFISISTSLFLNNEPIITLMIGIMSFTFILNPIGIIGLLFESKAQSKYSAQIKIVLAFLLPALKLLLVLLDQGILYFAALMVLESLFSISYTLFIYKKYFSKLNNKFYASKHQIILLLHDSWPLLFAGISTYLYNKMDQIMLLHFLDATAVGLYSVVVQLREVIIIIPGVLLGSVLPALVSAGKHNRIEYYTRLRYISIAILSIVSFLSLIIYVTGSKIILYLFGSDYAGSTEILNVFIWTAITSVAVQLIRHYLVIENKVIIYFFSTLVGIISNILLNLWLIPIYGARGAALATLLTFCTVLLTFGCFKTIRLGILMTIFPNKLPNN
jgi:O-antigen/teichoic acid export membrane protein